jgi:hypothetical protein
MDSRTSNPMSINQLVQAVLDENPGTEHTYVAQNHRVENERKRRYAAMIGLEVAKRMQQRAVVEPKTDTCEEPVPCVSHLALREVQAALREAGYLGDDEVEGIRQLRALYDAARAAQPPSDNPHIVTEYQRGFDDGFKRAIECVRSSEPPSSDAPAVSPLEMARCFHETYERLAPHYGYATREATREFNAHSDNGRLMIAVCAEIIAAYSVSQPRVEWISVKDKLPEFGQAVVYFFSLVGSHVGHYDGQDQHGLPVFAGRNGFLAGDVTHWIPLPPRPVPYSGSTKGEAL